MSDRRRAKGDRTLPAAYARGGSKNILLAPQHGNAPAAFLQEAEPSEQTHRWRLVERRLLSPARRDAIECLVRLERADGEREQWRAGDLAELQSPFDPHVIEPNSFAASLPGPRHGAVSLLPGGWPASDWARKTVAPLRLPIASGARSATLDLLVFSGCDAHRALDADAARRLLLDTTVDLRILRSPAHWMPSEPFVFIGDFAAAALARAFIQEHRSGELVFLIEAGRGEASLSPQAILRHECWRDGTIRAMPKLGSMSEFASMLEAHGRQIQILMKREVPIVLAGASENFLSMVSAGLRDFLGDETMGTIKAKGCLRRIAL